MDTVKRVVALLCTGGVAIGLWGATPALAQKKSVAEEILDILKASHQISDQQYQDLLNKAKAETEQRDAGVEAFQRDAVKDVTKKLDWLDRVSLFGDVRTRVEGFFQSRSPSALARTRERIRLRFGARLKISDELEGAIRLVSGDPGNPISTNQTMDNLFTRKPISIDWAYITVTPGKSFGIEMPWAPLSITAGKFPNPLFRPRAIMNSEMVWDDDLSPEGLNETFTFYNASDGVLRRFQLNTIQWMVKEQAQASDSWVLGGQFVAGFQPFPSTRLTLGAADYDFVKPRLIAQERNTNGSLTVTNAVVLKDGTIIHGGFPISPGKSPIRNFLSDWNVFNVGLQLDYDTGYPRWPLGAFIDYATNIKAYNRDDTAIWAGASIGAPKNPGDLAFSVVWGRVETESVLSVFNYDDFGRTGGTNVQGPIVKVDYLLLPHLTLTAKNHFVSFVDRPRGQSNSMVHRLQFDVVFSF